FAIAVDAAGNMYVVGYTYSTNFPAAGAFQTTRHGPANDAFVTKVNPVTGLVSIPPSPKSRRRSPRTSTACAAGVSSSSNTITPRSIYSGVGDSRWARR